MFLLPALSSRQSATFKESPEKTHRSTFSVHRMSLVPIRSQIRGFLVWRRMSRNTDDILAERGARYGSFIEDARLAQTLKDTLKSGVNWDKATPAQREALEMICTKMGRIVNGDPNYADSWSDIQGYARLIEQSL